MLPVCGPPSRPCLGGPAPEVVDTGSCRLGKSASESGACPASPLVSSGQSLCAILGGFLVAQSQPLSLPFPYNAILWSPTSHLTPHSRCLAPLQRTSAGRFLSPSPKLLEPSSHLTLSPLQNLCLSHCFVAHHKM